MLIDKTLFGIINKELDAINEIKAHEPPEGYYVADSGGKDSCVVRDLVRRSGVKYDSHFHLTTVDPPEVIRFIRNYHPETKTTHPPTTMWKLIEKKRMPPTRMVRYCCEVFKEGHGEGRIVVLGIRHQESNRRRKRKMIEGCNKPRKNKVYFSPIIHWSASEVWEYIRKHNIPYCSLYDEGHNRIGCIMCPMSGKKGMRRDADRWPKYYNNYIRAFGSIIQRNIRENRQYRVNFNSAEEMMDWWINGKSTAKEDPRQLRLEFVR